MITVAPGWAKWLLLGAALSLGAQAAAEGPNPRDWIINEATDEARFRILQRYLRGFDQPMWEVGERYGAVRQAIRDGNLELAAYHWRKIKVTIENGYLKRPARRANADALFLDTAWPALRDALASGGDGAVQAAFTEARRACMACHDAEDVSYMNRQPMFEPFPLD